LERNSNNQQIMQAGNSMCKQIPRPACAVDKEFHVTQWILISPFQAAERREIFLAAKTLTTSGSKAMPCS
jgi:hypothetical protein